MVLGTTKTFYIFLFFTYGNVEFFTVHICDGVTLTNSASEVRQLKAKEAPNSDLPCAVGEVARQTRLSHHIGPKHCTGMENPSEMSLDKRAVEPSHNVCLFSLPRQQGRDSLLLQAGSTEQPQNVSKSIHYTETLVEGGEEETVSTRLLPSSLRQIEPKEKNIKCDFCSYATHRKSHLNEHYRNIHLKVKVICDLCGKEFSSKLYIMKS